MFLINLHVILKFKLIKYCTVTAVMVLLPDI